MPMFASARERVALMSGLAAAVLVGLAFAPALIAAQTPSGESTHPSLDKRRITGTLAMGSD
jgi:hypothetical protein